MRKQQKSLAVEKKKKKKSRTKSWEPRPCCQTPFPQNRIDRNCLLLLLHHHHHLYVRHHYSLLVY